MVVCDWNEHKIAVYNLASGELQSSFGGRGTEPGLFSFPIKACFSPATGNLLIADCYNGRIQVSAVAA